MDYITHSEEETRKLGEAFAENLKRGDVVALFGDLGAGKTAFTRGAAGGLSINAVITSPTFTILQEYKEGKMPLYHFDMYRVLSGEGLEDIGFFDYIPSDGVTFIEWSENISEFLPKDCYKIWFERISDLKRKITVEGGEEK